jgi:MoxR-like ATPase
VVDAVLTTVKAPREVVELAVIALMAGGHLLIEDVPGVGKTTLAKALAAAISARSGRIQFTPDLLPGDILGVSVFNSDTRAFEFRPGPVFNNIIVADEINRANPKSQSALLEAMQEGQVSVDGVTHPLPQPFTVIATENPIEIDGTYQLPEAQRDRFMICMSIGYPSRTHEVEILDAASANSLARQVALPTPVARAEDVLDWMDDVNDMYVAPVLKDYIVSLATASRSRAELSLGASPRASLQLLQAAKAAAILAGRNFVLPDDIQAMLYPLWNHRLVLTRKARSAGATPKSVLRSIVESVPV